MKKTTTTTTVTTTVQQNPVPAPKRRMRLVKRVRTIVVRTPVHADLAAELARAARDQTVRPATVLRNSSGKVIGVRTTKVRIRPRRAD